MTLAKSRAQKKKMMANSLSNFTKHLAKSKSLLQELQEKGQQHPQQDNEIYATIRVPEILKGLTAEDFRQMDKEKALEFRRKLDRATQDENHLKEGELFMGMTDQEIMDNKTQWIALGLM